MRSAAGELRVEYQPVVELASDRCVGAEALLRWDHPEQGRIDPGVFVPLAETSGLMDELTRHVLRSIGEDLGEHLRRDASFHLAINLWPGHLADEPLQAWLEAFLESSGVRARQLILELTERTVIPDEDREARKLLQELRRRGFRLALDDFGAGYSSLAYLENFDLDYLKIDKHFVGAIGSDALTAHLVEAIADLAHRLELRVIAEGVETAEQRDHLASRDVEWAQGWLYAPALPAVELLNYVRRGFGPGD